MRFQVRTKKRPISGGLDGTIFTLEDPARGDSAEVWPALGMNCFRWQAAWQGRSLELLYAAPNLFDDPRPTRSGIPVLFPFPNRIRDGRFTWDGREYQLPKNDSTGKNAIHGFACRRPWRVVDQGADEDSAWVTGEFRGSADAPDTAKQWPADQRIQLTIRLKERMLRLEAAVDNPGTTSLPFGLGYHPYFRVPLLAGGSDEQCLVQVNANTYWQLDENLPTGRLLPVDSTRELSHWSSYSELKLDDLLVAAGPSLPPHASLRGRIRQNPDGVELRVSASQAFRETVVFTPPHRQAFCIEPYTCATDAINLQQQGMDAGLLVLGPGESWTGVVELSIG